MAARLPRYGVTAFCPTTIACRPDALGRVLDQIRRARESPAPRSARVLPAHLESNFINPRIAARSRPACLRTRACGGAGGRAGRGPGGEFAAADILREIERGGPDVGIVTLAPELDGGLDLIAWLSERGHRVSLGHSGASYEQALDAIAAGARQATHLFNRMPPFHHRSPGLAGAILQTAEVAAEVICDGFHVHPAVVRMAIAAKGPSRIMAITDGTAASGLPSAPGQRSAASRLGRRVRRVSGGRHARRQRDDDGPGLEDVGESDGRSAGRRRDDVRDDSARELGLAGHGVVAPGAIADLVVLDARLSVVQTYVGGRLAYSRNTSAPASV